MEVKVDFKKVLLKLLYQQGDINLATYEKSIKCLEMEECKNGNTKRA